MERALYCKYSTIQRLCEKHGGWQFNTLPCFPKIYFQAKDIPSLPHTRDAYLAMLNSHDTTSRSLQKLDAYNEMLQSVEFQALSGIGETELKQSYNSLFSDIDLSESTINRYGVETLRDELTRHWFQNIVKGDRFSWADFFKGGNLPLSNSVIIMDRYLFKVGIQKNGDEEKLLPWYDRGKYNLIGILNSIIPNDFTGDYHALVVFDDSQIEQRTKKGKYITVENALESISQFVHAKLARKKCNLVLEYLAIHNGKEIHNGASEDAKMENQFLKKLYGLTHDRRIISNYFMVNATHGWDAIDKKSLSTETQTLYYDSLCSGIDNPDQLSISDSIPINYIQSFIDLFVDALNNAKACTYKCFKYMDGKIQRVNSEDFCNAVLHLSKHPVKPNIWNPMDRLFQRG